MSQECNRCKEAGFAGQMIDFQKNGTKPDGSEHTHRTKPEVPARGSEPLSPEQQRGSDIQRLHNENMTASKVLTDAINCLASVIEMSVRAENIPENKKVQGGDMR